MPPGLKRKRKNKKNQMARIQVFYDEKWYLEDSLN